MTVFGGYQSQKMESVVSLNPPLNGGDFEHPSSPDLKRLEFLLVPTFFSFVYFRRRTLSTKKERVKGTKLGDLVVKS